ncbi:MAG TPA: transglutaminase domain-containing protein, partial [Candidatus Limnocylindrales bacterium]
MSAATVTAPDRRFAAFRNLPFAPVEGWLTLLVTGAMVVVLGWSLQEASWTQGPTEDGGFLPWVGFVGLAFGVGGAKVGWGRWRTHLVGAAFAGLVLPLIVGGIVLHTSAWDPNTLAHRYVASLDVIRRVWNDLAVLGLSFTNESAHYHLVFGAIVWAAGMLAGFDVFGHRRPLDAIVVLGLLLLANLGLTSHQQLPFLVAFSFAALLLLIRTHVFEEEVVWTRRKVGDPSSVRQLYLIAGAQFVIVAVLGSVLLTWTASSAPLQGLWRDLPQQLASITQWLQRYAPGGGDFAGPGLVSFLPNAPTIGQWQPSNVISFRAQLSPTEEQLFKWRAGTYAEYQGNGWQWGPTRDEPTEPGATLLGRDGSGDHPVETGRRQISARVMPEGFIGRTIIGPNTLLSVDRPSTAKVTGANGWYTTIATDNDPGTYNITALIPILEGDGALTEAELRLAGTNYPSEIREIYLALPKDAVGPFSTALLKDIRAAVVAPGYADPANAYDLARTMETYLRDDRHFTYDEDVRDEKFAQCGNASSVECFAIIRRGYCDYYASTMAVLLRSAGVPARIAYGFLPTPRNADGLEIVPGSSAHYWVEVYFPDIGWVEFDPTGGSIGSPVVLPSGSPPLVTPRPSGLPTSTPFDITAPPTNGPSAPPVTPPGTGIGPFIAIAFILMIVVIGAVYAAYRRTPTGPMHPD